jgi:hypothetical protein
MRPLGYINCSEKGTPSVGLWMFALLRLTQIAFEQRECQGIEGILN